jgi:L,D-transpeptidase YcbB
MSVVTGACRNHACFVMTFALFGAQRLDARGERRLVPLQVLSETGALGPTPRVSAVKMTGKGKILAHDRDAALSRVSRRAALTGLSTLLAAAGPATAQSNMPAWMKDLFGNTAYNTPDERAPKKQEVLNDLRPNPTPWRSDVMVEALESAIQRFEKIAANGGWPQIPGARSIRPEDDDERVPVLRRRLQAGGELKSLGGYANSYSFDGELDAALRRFQENYGLRVTGRADKSTLAALNVPVQARIAQMRLNLGRLRELTNGRIEERYILVNVAAFQLEAVERHEVQQRHRVIAGKPERQSPVVKAQIRALNFFPFWRVPDSVATLDLFPRLQKEPEYLAKEKIRVISRDFNGPELDPTNIDWRTADAKVIKFRQDPGPQNALGLVRIDMPNEHGVYMHDTPMKPLFQQRGRAFSAGCVRVQDVFKLVEWIARYEAGWDQPGRAEAVIDGGNALDVTLTRPIPVYFTYITAWAEPNGQVVFRPDVYGRDGIRDLTAGRERDETEGPAPAQAQSLAP